MTRQLRIARPVSDLVRATALYAAGLGLRVVASFEDHDGFDGTILAGAAPGWHLELTRCRTEPVRPTPTDDDLLVLYVPDRREWELGCERMGAAGFRQVASFNPYWDQRGRTFEDPDGYRIVLQNASWPAHPANE